MVLGKITIFNGILLHAKFNRFFIILGGGRKWPKSQFLVVLGVPYTGIWPKKPRKTLMRYQGFWEFFWVFFDLYIRGKWPKTAFLGKNQQILRKNRDFLPLPAKRKISPIFYNLRGVQLDQSYIRGKGACDPQEIRYRAGKG